MVAGRENDLLLFRTQSHDRPAHQPDSRAGRRIRDLGNGREWRQPTTDYAEGRGGIVAFRVAWRPDPVCDSRYIQGLAPGIGELRWIEHAVRNGWEDELLEPGGQSENGRRALPRPRTNRGSDTGGGSDTGARPLAVARISCRTRRRDIPGGSLALYPMRHTTGLAPHPLKNEVLVTVENEKGSRLVRANFDGSAESDLFFVPGIGIVAAVDGRTRLFDIKFSNDGSLVTFTQGVFAGALTDQASVWRMRPDASERVNLSEASGAGPKVNEGMSTFSPDGKRIVFRSSRNGNMNLYLMDADGKNIRQLTDGPWRDNFPVFSPDGKAIAFSSDRDGPKDVRGNRTFDNYILQLNPDGAPGALQRLTTDTGQDSHPYFSPDGNWVSFSSERSGINDEEPLVQEVVFAPQMYGEIFIQRISDGKMIRVTHNKWEEGTSFWLPPAGEIR